MLSSCRPVSPVWGLSGNMQITKFRDFVVFWMILSWTPGLIIMASAQTAFAYIDSPYWNDFPPSRGFPGRNQGSPVVSLDLDPQNILNSSFRISARENRTLDL